MFRIKQKTIITMIGIISLILLASCSIFFPNFLVGSWFGTDTNGETRITFTKEARFYANFIDENGNVENIEGTYSVGPRIIQFVYNQEKNFAMYTLYSNSIELEWKGKELRLGRFK